MNSVLLDATDRDDPPGQVSREALYDEVWRHPMLRVAERYGVSSSFMARVCTSMNVPRPPRGQWAKLEHGKPSPQAPLPDARPGDHVICEEAMPRGRPGIRFPSRRSARLPVRGRVFRAQRAIPWSAVYETFLPRER